HDALPICQQAPGVTIVAERVRPGRRNYQVRLFELALLFDQNRRGWSRFAGVESLRPNARAAFTTVKRLSDQLDQSLVIDIPGRRDDQVVVIKLARVKTNGDFVIESR